MRVDLFDFVLPEERIALRPAVPRDAARLLVVEPGRGRDDRMIADLPSLLDPGDVLVFNDTKVIPARLNGLRRRGGHAAEVEATLHMRAADDRWLAFMRPAKRVAPGDRISFGHGANACLLGALDATVVGDDPPLPPHWGGFRVAPAEVEFWQGRESRLHDRLRYRKDETGWIVERLSP